MVDQIAAHGMVNVHLEGDFELCSDAIDARDQHRIKIFLGVDRKQATEPADLAQYAAGEGFMGEILDSLFGAVSAVDVYAGVGIGDSGAIRGVVGHWNQSVFMRRGECAGCPFKREKRSSAAHCSTFESAPDSHRSLSLV